VKGSEWNEHTERQKSPGSGVPYVITLNTYLQHECHELSCT